MLREKEKVWVGSSQTVTTRWNRKAVEKDWSMKFLSSSYVLKRMVNLEQVFVTGAKSD